jgi:hypothetical protein
MKYVNAAYEFYYQADLLGEHAKVNLTFTPQSKFLSTVKILWNAPFKDRAFQTKLIQLLTGNYGNYAKRGKQYFSKPLPGRSTKPIACPMRTGGNSSLVEYLDMTAHEQGQKESKKRQEENWRQSKDARKF